MLAQVEWDEWSKEKVERGKSEQVVSCKYSGPSAWSVGSSLNPCARCLKVFATDGAALFYTSPLPATVAVLRQYALHFLFTPNPPQPAIGSSDIPAPARNPFPFKEPANVLDRDRIVVPAGWDSYGKISILREGFQPARWAEAYDTDLESLSETNPQPNPEGARAQFSVLVGGDRGPPPRTLPAIIQPTPEQGFLQQHYETLAKDPTRDPRATFKQPVGAEERFGGATGASGVVGPMGSSSFSLPSVEKALVEIEGGGERDRALLRLALLLRDGYGQ